MYIVHWSGTKWRKPCIHEVLSFPCCWILQDWSSMIGFSIWQKCYSGRWMKKNGCDNSTLHTICLNSSFWEGQTLSLSYMDWTHCPPISIPKRIDSLHTLCWLFFPVAQSNVSSTCHSLWTYWTLWIIKKTGIHPCFWRYLSKQSRIQTPLSYTFILYYLPPWFHPSWSLMQLLQMPERLSTRLSWHQKELPPSPWQPLLRTVNEADWDSRCCRHADSVSTFTPWFSVYPWV